MTYAAVDHRWRQILGRLSDKEKLTISARKKNEKKNHSELMMPQER